jgi:hypothetical protein
MRLEPAGRHPTKLRCAFSYGSLLGPFNVGTPPCPLGVLMPRGIPRGSQKLSPRSNYYTTDLYYNTDLLFSICLLLSSRYRVSTEIAKCRLQHTLTIVDTFHLAT